MLALGLLVTCISEENKTNMFQELYSCYVLAAGISVIDLQQRKPQHQSEVTSFFTFDSLRLLHHAERFSSHLQ